MLNPEKLSGQVTKTVQTVMEAAAERAKEQCGAALDAAAQLREQHSHITLAVTDRSKIVLERAMRDGSASLDFARRVVDHGSASAKSFASVKTPADLLVAQDAFLRTSYSLFSTELSATTHRFIEAFGDWSTWPGFTKLSAAT